MLDSVIYNFEPTWSIGPAVISIVAFLVVSFLLFSRPNSRGPVGYAAFIGSLAGLINYVIIMVLYCTGASSSVTGYPATFVFQGIYLSFAFVPGLIGFRRISKENNSVAGKMTALFGYLWAFVVIVVGFALTIILAVNINDMYSIFYSPSIHFSKLLLFMNHSGWAFVAAYLILLSVNLSSTSGTSHKTIIIYSVLNILSVLVYTIVANTRIVGGSIHAILSTIFAVPLVFCNIPIALGFIIATYYGSLWGSNSDAIKGGRVEILESNDSSRVDVER
ncbi:unnamed protein product [Mucor hiemalis]